MALIVNNLITKGMSGRYGKVLVFKQYGGKTVATAYPTPTNKQPTPLQIARRQQCAKAVAMTRLWLQNADQKRFLEQLADHWSSLSAYHAGIKYFMLGQPQVLENKAAKTLKQPAYKSAGQPTYMVGQAFTTTSTPTRKGDLYASLAGYF